MKTQKNNKKAQKRTKINLLKIIVPLMLAGIIISSIFVIMNEISKHQNDSSNSSDNHAVSQQEDPIKSDDPNPDDDSDDDIIDDKDTSGGSDKPSAPTTNPSTGLKNASVEITSTLVSDGQVSASGQVANVAETSGTCTYTLIHASTGQTITESVPTLPSASYTICTAVSFDQSKFASGTWSVKLKYQSSYSEGESNSGTIQIN